jgi:predicted nucleic acid-binding protein
MVKIGQIVIAKETFDKLYRKGDKFKILDIVNNVNLISIKAMRLKDREIYYFEEDELDDGKSLN